MDEALLVQIGHIWRQSDIYLGLSFGAITSIQANVILVVLIGLEDALNSLQGRVRFHDERSQLVLIEKYLFEQRQLSLGVRWFARLSFLG